MRNFLVISLLLLAVSISMGETGSNKDRTSGKKVVLRLEPGPGNPRISEGDFIDVKDGCIVFIYSHYTGGSGRDDDSAYLAARNSGDKGKTWNRKSRSFH